MSIDLIKLSASEVITRTFPAVFTVERWRPWGGASDPYPGVARLTLQVHLAMGRLGGGKELGTFEGRLEGDGVAPPRFVPTSPLAAGSDLHGPNTLWLRLNASTEEPLHGPFQLTLPGAGAILSVLARLEAGGRSAETHAPCIVRPADRVLDVEPLSQFTSKFGDASWELGRRIRDTWNGGVATLDRDWGDVLMRARPGDNNPKPAGEARGGTFAGSSCSYLALTMLLRYLREADDRTVFERRVTAPFEAMAAAEGAKNGWWPRRARRAFDLGGVKASDLADKKAVAERRLSSSKVDSILKPLEPSVALSYHPAQLAWLVSSRSKGSNRFDEVWEREFEVGGERRTIEGFKDGLSWTPWHDDNGLVLPLGGGLREALGLVPWVGAPAPRIVVRKGKKKKARAEGTWGVDGKGEWQELLDAALADGLPVLTLVGDAEHWVLIVGKRQDPDGGPPRYVMNDSGGWAHLQYLSPADSAKSPVPVTRRGQKAISFAAYQPGDWTPARQRSRELDWDVVPAK